MAKAKCDYYKALYPIKYDQSVSTTRREIWGRIEKERGKGEIEKDKGGKGEG